MDELKKQKNKFFAITPNFVVDNLTAIPLAVYSTMKRVIGEDYNKECYFSNKTYKKRLKVGNDALKDAIETLIDNNLIYEVGKKEIPTSGGPQRVMHYRIYNITNFNKKYYEGRPKTTPLNKIGAPKNDKRYAVLRHKEELIKEEKIISLEEQEKIKKLKEDINSRYKTRDG